MLYKPKNKPTLCSAASGGRTGRPGPGGVAAFPLKRFGVECIGNFSSNWNLFMQLLLSCAVCPTSDSVTTPSSCIELDMFCYLTVCAEQLT